MSEVEELMGLLKAKDDEIEYLRSLPDVEGWMGLLKAKNDEIKYLRSLAEEINKELNTLKVQYEKLQLQYDHLKSSMYER
jgi:hypothetical protein